MHMAKEKNQKRDIRSGALPSGFHIEVDKILSNVAVSVNNVFSIVDFRDDAAILKMRKGKIKISGDGLSISIYENKIVEIIGKVRNIEFL